MHHRKVPTVAGGVEGGSGLGHVLAHDRGVANLRVAQGELVMRESDRP